MSRPWVCNVREQVLGGFESQNQTDRAIKLQWAILLKYPEVRNNTKKCNIHPVLLYIIIHKYLNYISFVIVFSVLGTKIV